MEKQDKNGQNNHTALNSHLISRLVPYSDLVKIMEDLGFTNYEIKILTAMYQGGSSKAEDLANMAKVPLARTYDALEILRRKNFVSSSSGRPRVYTANNPQVAIARLIEQETQKYQNMASHFSNNASAFLELAQQLYFEKHTEIMPEDLLIHFATLDETEKKTLKIIQSAKKSILIFTQTFNWFPRVKSELNAALGRGCQVMVLLSPASSQATQSGLKNIGAKIKYFDKDEHIKTRGTIIDDQKVIFVIWATEGKNIQRRIYQPQYSSNKGIVEVFKHFFENLWEKH